METIALDDLQLLIGRTFATEIVPEEAPFFDDLIAASSSASKPKRDHTLGFGISAEELGYASVIFFTVAKPIVDFIWANAKDSVGNLIKDAAEDARIAFKRKLKEWSDSAFKAPRPFQLDRGQVDSIVSTVHIDARKAGLDEKKSRKLSEVVAKLLESDDANAA